MGYISIKTQKLAEMIRKIKTKRNLINFLDGILTPEELDEIYQRIQIVKMLKAYTPQHDIARILHVGVGTVTRGSKMLKTGHFRYIKVKNAREWWA